MTTAFGSSANSSISLLSLATGGERACSLQLRVKRHIQSFIVAIALQLATPQTAEIHIEITVSIIQDGRVDTVTAFHRVGLGNERSFRLSLIATPIRKNIILVFQGEIHVIFSVFPALRHSPIADGLPKVCPLSEGLLHGL